MPTPPAMSPFRSEPWLTVAVVTSPNTTSQKISGWPKAITSGRMTWISSARIKSPNSAPSRQAPADSPSARAASPRLAMG